MDSVQSTVPKTEVAEGSHMGYAKKAGMSRPKKLVKGSAATKRWMAHLRSMKKSSKKAKTPARKVRKVSRKSSKKAKTPARKARKTPARRGRKPGPKKGSRKARKSSPKARKVRKTPARKVSRKGRKSSPKRK